MPILILMRSYYFHKIISQQPSFIEQDHKDIHNETSSCTSKGYEIVLELYMNAPSYNVKGHEVMPELCMKIYT